MYAASASLHKTLRPAKEASTCLQQGEDPLDDCSDGACLIFESGFLGPADKAFQERMRANGGHSQAFSQATIKQATKNYGNVIGRGGFGDVFYGKLPDGQEVAAKVLSATSHQSKQEFYNEVGAHCQVSGSVYALASQTNPLSSA